MPEVYNRSNPKFVSCRRLLVHNSGSTVVINRVIGAGGSVNGFKNPAWREQVSDHKLATTSCTGSLVSLDPGYVIATFVREDLVSGVWKQTNNYANIGQLFQNSTIPGPSNVLPLTTSKLYRDAMMRFYRDAYEKQVQFSGMQFLGELRETVRLLKHPFRTLLSVLEKREKRLAKMVRKGAAGRKLDNFRRAAADTWLETNFGLLPLVRDVEDLSKTLVSRWDELDVEYHNVVGSARSPIAPVIGTVDQLQSTVTNVSWYFRWVHFQQQKVRFKGQIKVDPLKGEWSHADLGRLGFGLQAFIPTLYELTPWSFLLDYFADVGGLIESFSVPRHSIVWSQVTRRAQVVSFFNYVSVSQTTSPTVRYRETGIIIRPVAVSRKVFDRVGFAQGSLPRPRISLSLPNGRQFANIVALASSRSRNRFSHL